MYMFYITSVSLSCSFSIHFQPQSTSQSLFVDFQAFFAFPLPMVLLGIFLKHCMQTWISIFLCTCNTIDIDLISFLFLIIDFIERQLWVLKLMSDYRYKPATIWCLSTVSNVHVCHFEMYSKLWPFRWAFIFHRVNIKTLKMPTQFFFPIVHLAFCPALSRLWRLACHWA